MSGEVRDNPDRSRFELEVDGQIVRADYRRHGSSVIITHVEAPPSLRGTGAADRLMRGIVAMAEQEDWQLVPVCGYAAAWLRHHARRRERRGTSQ
ncbi:GNAT family N-acetyltransferase [Rhodoligotrophos defluvii]|uniref:GNAT family N-acetyltransferase n=1 Tax=Rhodoligotrophos defluvii TaxID=2561934 RepID=UPI001EEFE810|nr:GNAT family N-acetyltransferase [Rhodoligotrophos defluvii]